MYNLLVEVLELNIGYYMDYVKEYCTQLTMILALKAYRYLYFQIKEKLLEAHKEIKMGEVIKRIEQDSSIVEIYRNARFQESESERKIFHVDIELC